VVGRGEGGVQTNGWKLLTRIWIASDGSELVPTTDVKITLCPLCSHDNLGWVSLVNQLVRDTRRETFDSVPEWEG